MGKKPLCLFYLLLFVFIVCHNHTLQAENITVLQARAGEVVTGTVRDSANNLLPGVTIQIKGTSEGTTTDINGKYVIDVDHHNAVLVFSMVGYTPQEIPIAGRSVINVVLELAASELDQAVIVAFGTQKKSSMVSSIETINPRELKTSSSNLTTALAGRLSGVIAYQRSGEPGNDNADFFIRGVSTFGYKKDPLILIDGIETTSTELARLQPDDVDGFSILKDATATALYGARGANGVILITTKEGVEGPARVSLRYEHTLSYNTQDIQLADPITYMMLGNEAALAKDPLAPIPYPQAKIDNTLAGTNPYVYPANNWLKELIKDQTVNKRFNFSVKGGGRVARYYVSGSVNQDNGNLKVHGRSNFNNNIDLKSYSLRSNISINVTHSTKAIVRLSGTFDDYSGPIDGGTGIYNKIMQSNPVLFPAYFPDDLIPGTKHILFGNALNSEGGTYLNPYTDMVKGYKDYNKSLLDAQFELSQNLSFITKGLKATGRFNISRYAFYDVIRAYNPYFYSATAYNKMDNTYKLNLLNASDDPTEYLDYSENIPQLSSTNYLEASLIYNNEFANVHEVSGLLVATRQQQLHANTGTLQKSLPYRNQGISGRFTYGYDSRYLFEFDFGYNGSERFDKKHRYGFFPAVGVGWSVSNEDFWEPFIETVNKLKLKATYGLVGNDAIGSADDRFFYLSEVNMQDGDKSYTFGQNYAYSRNGVTVGRYPNSNITWEIAHKLNLGIEMDLFNSLEIQADYFTETRENILMDRASIPTILGLSAPVRANVGRARSHGVDISLDYNKWIGRDIWIKGRGNFTYANNTFLAYEEPAYPEKYLSHKGHPINQQWGLIAEHLFIDQHEIDNSPNQNYGEYKPGDIKYYDTNGDGQITDLDKVPIGYPTTPEIVYGFGFSAGYRQFDLSAFFQGSARSSFWIDAAATSPFVNQQQLLKAYADNHWSEQNRNLYATWPRLSTTITDNNIQTSTWLMRNGAFLRLKQVELGYSLPEKILKSIHLSLMRIYVNSGNVFLWSHFDLWDIEMGGNGLGYPIQRTFNFGVNVEF